MLRSGDPRAALTALTGEVRKAPRDVGLRVFLFQLLCVLGQWERALNQLIVAAELDGTAIPMAETYRVLIRCELLREGVFAGRRTPTLFGHPMPWVAPLLEANRLVATGAYEEAARLRDEVFDLADAIPGSIDDHEFEWFADADPRLGPVLEAIVDGTYYWIPFQNVAAMTLEPPIDLRDQVWMPVSFTWTNGGQAIGFIPTRYPGSAAVDPALALARRTEWRAEGPAEHGWTLGLGQRMFTTGDVDIALMDMRHLTLDAPAAA